MIAAFIINIQLQLNCKRGFRKTTLKNAKAYLGFFQITMIELLLRKQLGATGEPLHFYHKNSIRGPLQSPKYAL